MKQIILFLALVGLVGCSGESAPEVGDAPIAKGIERKPGIKLRDPRPAQNGDQKPVDLP